MASRLAMLKRTTADSVSFLGPRRWLHASAVPPPLDAPISQPTVSQPLVLPESDQIPDSNSNNNIVFGFGFPSFPFEGSMKLMAVPKKKVSRHKRGIRNGPRALKPVPVIIRCKLVNEHLNNVGKYRTFKSVLLPFIIDDEVSNKALSTFKISIQTIFISREGKSKLNS